MKKFACVLKVRGARPPVKCSGIPRSVPHRNHGTNAYFDRKINGVSAKTGQTNLAGTTAHMLKNLGFGTGFSQRCINFQHKLLSQTRSLLLVPTDGVGELSFGPRLKNEGQLHRQPNGCVISAWICSKGIPPCGFCSNSANQRSTSAAWSGVSSSSVSPNSDRTHSTTSHWASGGERRISSMISVALMDLIFLAQPAAQALFHPTPCSN